MNATKASLNQRGDTALIPRLLKHENSLKTKIAGKDGLVDVYEFDTLTYKWGWPKGLELEIQAIEDSLNK